MAKAKSDHSPTSTQRPASLGRTVAVGLTLIVLGALAILLPQQATIAAGAGLGALLVLAGAVTIVHSVREKGVDGFNWNLLAGAAEAVGGILIWISPIKGAAAIALLVVIVVAVQGATHLLMALKLRRTPGRAGLAASGVVCLLIALMLVLRFPYQSVSEPGAMAGIALVVAGIAHFILASARRGAASPRSAT